MIYKAILIAALLGTGSFVVSYIRDGYSFGSVVPPERELSEASLHLAGWEGRDLPVNDRLREILRAKSGIDRVYESADGVKITVHCVWTDDYLQLHFPQQCYRESGWAEQGATDVIVKSKDGTVVPAKILDFAQGSRKTRVLYWFQLGEHVFLDRIEHRRLRHKVLWGQKEWPPLMKFMLETSDDPESDQRLIEFAGELHGDVFRADSSVDKTTG